MNELDKLAAQLSAEGYYVGLKRRKDDWECELWNGCTKPHFVPIGHGKTNLEAVQAAISDRDQKLARK